MPMYERLDSSSSTDSVLYRYNLALVIQLRIGPVCRTLRRWRWLFAFEGPKALSSHTSRFQSSWVPQLIIYSRKRKCERFRDRDRIVPTSCELGSYGKRKSSPISTAKVRLDCKRYTGVKESCMKNLFHWLRWSISCMWWLHDLSFKPSSPRNLCMHEITQPRCNRWLSSEVSWWKNSHVLRNLAWMKAHWKHRKH